MALAFSHIHDASTREILGASEQINLLWKAEKLPVVFHVIFHGCGIIEDTKITNTSLISIKRDIPLFNKKLTTDASNQVKQTDI